MQKELAQFKDQDTLQSENRHPSSQQNSKTYKIAIGIISFFLICFIGATIGLGVALKDEVDEKYIELSYSSWTKLQPKTNPPKRQAHQAEKINSKEMVIFGGFYGNPLNAQYKQAYNLTKTYGDMWIYNVEKKNWREVKQKGQVPSPRLFTSLSRIDDKLYLFGGFNGYSDWGAKHDSYGDFYEFNIKTHTWKSLPTTGGPGKRGNHRTVAEGRKIYLLGGGASLIKRKNENVFFEYDVDTQVWKNYTSKLPIGLEGRFGFAMVNAEGTAYIFGGNSVDNSLKIYYPNDFWKLQLSTLEFTEITASGNLPASRCATTGAASLFGHVFLIAGHRFSGGINFPINDIDLYSAKTQRWYQLYTSWRSTILPRMAHTVTEINNKLYAFGGRVGTGEPGYNDVGTNSLWCYIPPKYVYKDDGTVEIEKE